MINILEVCLFFRGSKLPNALVALEHTHTIVACTARRDMNDRRLRKKKKQERHATSVGYAPFAHYLGPNIKKNCRELLQINA